MTMFNSRATHIKTKFAALSPQKTLKIAKNKETPFKIIARTTYEVLGCKPKYDSFILVFIHSWRLTRY